MRAIVDVEGGQHGDVANAHTDDVAGVAGTVEPPVQVPSGRGGERDGPDDQRVVVLAPAHGRQDGRGGEYDGDRGVEPSPGTHMTPAALASQRGDRPGDYGGEAGDDVDCQECQEHRCGGAHL